MSIISIAFDSNIFDKLDENSEILELLIRKIDENKINAYITPIIYYEISDADEKNNSSYLNLFPFIILDEKLSFPPLMPGKFNIGGDESQFNYLVGNVTSNKKKKDRRILDTVSHHGVSYFVTNDKSGFNKDVGVDIIDYDKFKELLIFA